MPPKKARAQVQSALDNRTMYVDVECLSIIVQRMRCAKSAAKIEFKHPDVDLISVEINGTDELTKRSNALKTQINKAKTVKEQIDLTNQLTSVESRNKKSIFYGFSSKHVFANTLRLFAPLYVTDGPMFAKVMEMFGKFSSSFSQEYNKYLTTINVASCSTLTEYVNMIVGQIKPQTFETYMSIIENACNIEKFCTGAITSEEHQINQLTAAYLNLVRYVSMYLRTIYNTESLMVLDKAKQKTSLVNMTKVSVDVNNIATWLEELLPMKAKKTNTTQNVKNIVNMALAYIATGLLIPIDFDAQKSSFLHYDNNDLDYLIAEYSKIQLNFPEYLATKIE